MQSGGPYPGLYLENHRPNQDEAEPQVAGSTNLPQTKPYGLLDMKDLLVPWGGPSVPQKYFGV